MTPRSNRSTPPFHPPEQGKQQRGTDQAFLDLETPPVTCDVPAFQAEPLTGGSSWNAPPPGVAEPAERLAEIRQRRAAAAAVRAAFTEARQAGLARRHAAKLARNRAATERHDVPQS